MIADQKSVTIYMYRISYRGQLMDLSNSYPKVFIHLMQSLNIAINTKEDTLLSDEIDWKPKWDEL